MIMILNLIFIILITSLLSFFFINGNNRNLLQTISLISSGLVLFLSCLILIYFDTTIISFQFVSNLNFLNFNILNLNLLFGLDGISILFFFLTSFLCFLCILFVQKENLLKEYLIALFLIELILLIVFSLMDLFLFYIFFEAILIPMYFLVGLWGSRERKIRAAYLLFFYTIVGSVLLLISILYIYSITGTFNFEYLSNIKFYLTNLEQKLLWLGFFISFSSKIPMFPFHIWLPEAHVEASTTGSVLLAGILLKLGVYGFVRYNLVLFPEASEFFTPLVYTLSLIGVIFASFNAIRQTDLKRIVAYSSIAHMNLVVMGLFSFDVIGLQGALLQSISHGFVAGSLFFLIGILYNRYHSRILHYYGGLTSVMPLYAGFFLVFTMANIALPGTSSFIGEFLILLGIYSENIFAGIISTLSVIFSGAYSLWLYNRIMFGNLQSDFTLKFKDLNEQEFLILLPMCFFVILLGVYPMYFLNFFNFATTLYYNF